MKLYTKEQVTNVLQKYWLTSGVSDVLEKLLEQEKSIELPSDKEIEKQALLAEDNDLSPVEEWERGAKWLKEHITKNK